MFFVSIGAMFMLFAILIIVMPELLALLFAGLVMFVGISLVGIGLNLRRVTKAVQSGKHKPGQTTVVVEDYR